MTGESEASAPWEITPSAGDTFTVLETWLDLDENGEVANTASQPGSTLTFGDRMFTWETLDAAIGQTRSVLSSKTWTVVGNRPWHE